MHGCYARKQAQRLSRPIIDLWVEVPHAHSAPNV